MSCFLLEKIRCPLCTPTSQLHPPQHHWGLPISPIAPKAYWGLWPEQQNMS